MKLSLTTRIFLGYAVVLVTFGAVSAFSVLTLRQNQVEIRLVSEGYLGLSQTVAAIETFQANQAKDTTRLRDEENVDARRGLIRLARLFFPGLMADRLKAGREAVARVLEFAPEAEQPFVRDLGKKFEELERRFQDYEAAADETFRVLEAASPDQEKANVAIDRLQQIENALSATIRLLHGSIEARIHDRVRLTQERERRTGAAIILMPVVAIGVGLLATGLAARSLRPVRTLIEGVTRIRQGDYEAKIGVDGNDEIAVLAREFDAMARALKERETQLQQKQQELIRIEQLAAVGRISAQVAHEIRNPLSSIGLNMEMLGDQLDVATFATEGAAKETKELLQAVLSEVDRLTEITEDYLRLARLPTPNKRPEDLHKLLEEVLNFARSEFNRAQIEVQQSLPEGPIALSADESQLRQVFLNLFRNAREAMRSGGVLSVSVRRQGPWWEVRVGDTGSGISKEVASRLFEPFFTTKPQGTGLGLSLSRQIIEGHGGRIRVESTAERGTTFLIELPCT